jgi:methyl-accepting chemotaxis protein
LVIVVGFLLGSHFLAPVEQIEEGILRVINGDLEHRFEVRSSEFGGLAYRVNQLVAELTGEEEVEEE